MLLLRVILIIDVTIHDIDNYTESDIKHSITAYCEVPETKRVDLLGTRRWLGGG